MVAIRKRAAPSPSSPQAVETASPRSKRIRKGSNDDIKDSGADANGRDVAAGPSRLAGGSGPLSQVSSALIAKSIPLQRAAVLNRMSGDIKSTSDLTDLDTQAEALRTTVESTVKRGESNSVLLVGAKGSGKSALLKGALADIDEKEHSYHHVYISALECSTDRLAMRELGRQLITLGALGLESGNQLGLDEDEEEDDQEDDHKDDDIEDDAEEEALADQSKGGDADDEDEKAALGTAVLSSLSNTTSSILSLLASTGSKNSKAKPLLITLDHFDLLTSRPRQALLYCLLDAVQSGTYQPGLAIIGMTRRIDTTDLLEKRVKSRFSHRIIQCYPPRDWSALIGTVLSTSSDVIDEDFKRAWQEETDLLLSNPKFSDFIQGIVDLSQDVHYLFSIVYSAISPLDAERNFSPNNLQLYLDSQQSLLLDDTTLDTIYELPTLEFLFLIASKQLQLKDRVVFNFEIALDEIVKFSKKAKRDREGLGTGGMGLNTVSTNGGIASPTSTPSGRREKRSTALNSPTSGNVTSASSLAYVSPWEDRQRAMMAFEQLLALEIFLPDAFLSTLSFGPSTSGSTSTQAVRKEYLRVRSILNPHTITQIAKERASKGTLGTEIVQWATRSHA
ncbi:unnamed protein product [Sympodiomycopsis kandeliae]